MVDALVLICWAKLEMMVKIGIFSLKITMLWEKVPNHFEPVNLF
jgi:hypothetical protein